MLDQINSKHLALVASRAERFRPTNDNLNTASLVDEVDRAVVTGGCYLQL